MAVGWALGLCSSGSWSTHSPGPCQKSPRKLTPHPPPWCGLPTQDPITRTLSSRPASSPSALPPDTLHIYLIARWTGKGSLFHSLSVLWACSHCSTSVRWPSKPSTHSSPFQGVLRIHFIEAQDLQGKDTYLKGLIKGKSDPYGIIRVGNQIFQSKVIKESLSPKWNEVYEVRYVQWHQLASPHVLIPLLWHRSVVGLEGNKSFLL